MHLFIVQMLPFVQLPVQLHSWYWNSLFFDDSAYFLQLEPVTETTTVLYFAFHKVPITAGRTEAV